MDKLETARQAIERIDKEMAKLFEERISQSQVVAEYKIENNLKIKDAERENALINKNLSYITKDENKDYYKSFIKNIIDLSCSYQEDILSKEIPDFVNSNIIIKRHSIYNIADYIDINRKVMIVTDTGVPVEYSNIVKSQIKDVYVHVFEQGEANKNIDEYKSILNDLLEHEFTRKDLVIAVGGGVVGDMAGFAASTYMRGIEFINIPTTLLSQVDSSIGGKTAVDFKGYKNSVGAFHMPSKVIIDSEVLKTLDDRQFNNGLCEAIKMAATCDNELFELIENSADIREDIDEVIIKSLKIKNYVVKKDPKEKDLRRVLNYGHTVGHAIETAMNGKLLHGECVAIGMLVFAEDEVESRLKNILRKYNLPITTTVNDDELLKGLVHDKKKAGNDVCVVCVDKIGSFQFKNMTVDEIIKFARKIR